MDKNFWDKVRERAYMNYLNRMNTHSEGDELKDWLDAKLDEMLEEKIAHEAYLNYLRYGSDPVYNWEHAQKNVLERVSFLAYYIHEKKYNQHPIDNWKEAENIYIENF
ncbi:MAG: hypothetical protein WC197_04175 [Candidatus Gastranaerophilaceae bacterium]